MASCPKGSFFHALSLRVAYACPSVLPASHHWVSRTHYRQALGAACTTAWGLGPLMIPPTPLGPASASQTPHSWENPQELSAYSGNTLETGHHGSVTLTLQLSPRQTSAPGGLHLLLIPAFIHFFHKQRSPLLLLQGWHSREGRWMTNAPSRWQLMGWKEHPVQAKGQCKGREGRHLRV